MPAPEKEVNLPIESIEFSKDELEFIMDGLTDVIARSLEDFGKTARFILTMDLKHHPRKRTSCPK